VTVVFDGQPGQYFSYPVAHVSVSEDSPEIRVIFSDGCSADDQIKHMVDLDINKKNCVVVSNDKDVFLYARSLGARVMSVAAFTSKSKEVYTKNDSGGKYISLSRQEAINKELSQRWLKEKP